MSINPPSPGPDTVPVGSHDAWILLCDYFDRETYTRVRTGLKEGAHRPLREAIERDWNAVNDVPVHLRHRPEGIALCLIAIATFNWENQQHNGRGAEQRQHPTDADAAWQKHPLLLRASGRLFPAVELTPEHREALARIDGIRSLAQLAAQSRTPDAAEGYIRLSDYPHEVHQLSDVLSQGDSGRAERRAAWARRHAIDTASFDTMLTGLMQAFADDIHAVLHMHAGMLHDEEYSEADTRATVATLLAFETYHFRDEAFEHHVHGAIEAAVDGVYAAVLDTSREEFVL